MKKTILKSSTFYFMIVSLIMIYAHYIGQDPYGIVLFHLNILLKSVLYSESINAIMALGPKISCGSVAGEIYVFWYIAHLISFIIYGLCFDVIKFSIKKLRLYMNN